MLVGRVLIAAGIGVWNPDHGNAERVHEQSRRIASRGIWHEIGRSPRRSRHGGYDHAYPGVVGIGARSKEGLTVLYQLDRDGLEAAVIEMAA